MKKYLIQVRKYPAGETASLNNGKFELVKTIARKPWLEQIGNFSPMFCRYNHKRTLVHSDEGDLSDPFRRNENYSKTFFIILPVA